VAASVCTDIGRGVVLQRYWTLENPNAMNVIVTYAAADIRHVEYASG
jgi:hypothetical protein